MTTATHVFDHGLRLGSADLVHSDGIRVPMPLARWIERADDGDAALLQRCTGPTMDIGCGPGRLTAALLARGIPALGIDVSAVAVDMTNSRGGIALQRSVFDHAPGEHRWDHLLLADGNIGIGGDPVRLLARCSQLLAPGGTVLLDVEAPGTAAGCRLVRMEVGEDRSDEFTWCWVGAGEIAMFAEQAGLQCRAIWRNGGRWHAELAHPGAAGAGALVERADRP